MDASKGFFIGKMVPRRKCLETDIQWTEPADPVSDVDTTNARIFTHSQYVYYAEIRSQQPDKLQIYLKTKKYIIKTRRLKQIFFLKLFVSLFRLKKRDAFTFSLKSTCKSE